MCLTVAGWLHALQAGQSITNPRNKKPAGSSGNQSSSGFKVARDAGAASSRTHTEHFDPIRPARQPKAHLPQDGHVVGVEHPMHKPHRLPHGHQVTCPEGYLPEQLLILLRLACRDTVLNAVAEQVSEFVRVHNIA